MILTDSTVIRTSAETIFRFFEEMENNYLYQGGTMSSHFESLLINLSAEDRQEIPTIPERFVRRALAGDWDGVAELYDQAAIQMPPDQPAVEGRAAIRHALSRTLGAEGGVRLEELSLSIREAEGIGDLVYVWAAYRLKLSLMVSGEEVSIEQRGPYVNILRRDEAGHWRIYRQIYNRDHPPGMDPASPESERLQED
jgi:ketosteroid isomerase-like protein